LSVFKSIERKDDVAIEEQWLGDEEKDAWEGSKVGERNSDGAEGGEPSSDMGES
jgi:hypothetical protein